MLNSFQARQGALQDPATAPVAAQQVLMDATTAAAATATQIARLRAAGAGTVLVLNLPDIGHTPLAYATPAATELMTLASQRFNDTLDSELARDKGKLIVLDTYAMFNELIATPARFGLRNVTTPACPGDSNQCDRNALVAPGANRTYLFADAVHPTGIGHEFIVDYALSVMQAPARIGLLAEAPLAGARASLQAIDERLRTRDDSPAPQAYATYQHISDRQRDEGAWNPGMGNRIDMLNLGVDGAVGPHWMVGAGVAQIQHDASLGDHAGSLRLGQTLLSAYARYRLHAWSAALAGSIGYLDYRKVSRDFSIGPARLREQGATSGTANALSALTHYDWQAG
ncbi:autotransporter domain-containing protein, partial [Ralstonia pseudosolanacearum]|uniref:autotransporter domain-containing protein n=1 Tax=Ralstonia pseudosolanacearum TaxID=1310165 RepID=UPI003D2DB99C